MQPPSHVATTVLLAVLVAAALPCVWSACPPSPPPAPFASPVTTATSAGVNTFADPILVVANPRRAEQGVPPRPCAITVNPAQRSIIAVCDDMADGLAGFTLIPGPLYTGTAALPSLLTAGHLDATPGTEVVFGTQEGGNSKVYVHFGPTNNTVVIPVPETIHAVAIADMDGDGDNDIVVVRGTPLPVELVYYPNLGNGLSWGSLVMITTGFDEIGACPETMIIGQLSGDDSLIDVACADGGTGVPHVFPGLTPAGSAWGTLVGLVAPISVTIPDPDERDIVSGIVENTLSSAVNRLVVSDMTGDGVVDLVTVSKDNGPPDRAGVYVVHGVSPPIDDGGVQYRFAILPAPSRIRLTSLRPPYVPDSGKNLVVKDINGDGHVDVMVLSMSDLLWAAGPFVDPTVLPKPMITISTPPPPATPFPFDAYAVGNARGIGQDIFVGNGAIWSQIALLPTERVSSADAPVVPTYETGINANFYAGLKNPDLAAVGDVNLDGSLDAYMFFRSYLVYAPSLASWSSDMLLAAPKWRIGGSGTKAIAVAGSVDGDGMLDILFIANAELRLLAGAEAAAAPPSFLGVTRLISFPAGAPGDTLTKGANMVLGDLVGDGLGLDLVMQSPGGISWYPNADNAGNFSSVVHIFGADYPTPVTDFASGDVFMSLVDINDDGIADVVMSIKELGTSSVLYVFMANEAAHGPGLFGATAEPSLFMCNTTGFPAGATALTVSPLLTGRPLLDPTTPLADSALHVLFTIQDGVKNRFYACRLPSNPATDISVGFAPLSLGPSTGDDGGYGHSFTAMDINFDGTTDLTGLDTVGGVGFVVAAGQRDAAYALVPPVAFSPSGLNPTQAYFADVNGDGVADALGTDGSTFVSQFPGKSRFGRAGGAPVPAIAVAVDKCGFTLDCIAAAVAQAPASSARAGPYTVFLPRGRYTGCPPKGLPIRAGTNVVIHGPPKVAGLNHARIDCGGVGAVAAIGEGASLAFVNIDVTATGNSAFAVAGVGSVLSVANVTFSQTKTPASGSAVAVGAYGAATIADVTVTAAEAAINGGAFAATGVGAQLTIERTDVFGSKALAGSGGAVYFAGTGQAAALALNVVSLSSNQAQAGTGGGVAIGVGPGVGGSMAIMSVTAVGNSALNGGGVGLMATDAAFPLEKMMTNVVAVSALVCTDNMAGAAGGCLFSAASNARVQALALTATANRAVFGGAVAGVATGYAQLPTDAAGAVPPRFDEAADGGVRAAALGTRAAAFADGIGGVMLSGTVVIDGNEAAFGGGLFGCQMPLVFTGAATVEDTTLPASVDFAPGRNGVADGVDGSSVFVCAPRPGTLPTVTRMAIERTALYYVTPAREAFTRPAATSPPIILVRPIATPAYSLTVVNAAPASAVSGAPFGAGSVSVVDALGQPVTTAGLQLAVAFDSALALADLGLTLPGDAEVVSGAVLELDTELSAFDLSSVAVAGRVAVGAATSRVVTLPTPALPLTLTVVAPSPPGPAPPSPSVSITVPVTACAPGYGAVPAPPAPTPAPSILLSCAACGPNTYSATTGTEACAACTAPAFANGFGNTNCSVCGPLEVPSPSISGTVCMCAAGSYSTNSTGFPPCAPCPAGGVCPGGALPVQPAPGFSPSDSTPGEFVSCSGSVGCGSNGCKDGYTGAECTECQKDFFKLGQRCAKCDGRVVPMILVLFVLGLVLSGALVYFNTRTGDVHKFGAVMIALNSLQITAIYGKLSLNWGTLGETWLVVTSLSTYNLDLLTLECLDEAAKWKVKWVFTLCLPLLFLIPFAIVFVVGILFVKRAAKQEQKRTDDAATGDDMYEEDAAEVLTMGALIDATKRAYYQLLVLLFLPLTSASLGFFACTKKAGSRFWRLDEARYIRCYDGGYYGLLPVAIVATLVYVLGIPGAVAHLLFRKRAALSELDFALRYGFLVGRFEEASFAYELAIMGRKAGVVLAMVVFRAIENKANGALLVLGACLIHLALQLPYAAQLHNRLAIVCLAAVTMVLWGGTMESHAMSAVIVLGGIAVNIVAMVGGLILDWRRIKADEEGEGGEAFVGVLEYGGAVAEDGDAVKAEQARGGMADDSIALTILDDSHSSQAQVATTAPNAFTDSLAAQPAAATVSGDALLPPPPPPPVSTILDDNDGSSSSSSVESV